MTANNAAQKKPVKSGAHEAWFTQRRWKLLAFYLGVPLLVGIYGALNNWQLLRATGFFHGVLFYLAHALPPWLTTCATSLLAMLVLQRFKPPPWVIMLVGSVSACFIIAPVANTITGYYQQRWQITGLHEQIAPVFSIGFWRYMLSATLIWLLVNYIFDRFLGLPRYRYNIPRGYDYKELPPSADVAPADPDVRLPVFLSRIPTAIRLDDLLAVKAEQHYIKVVTSERSHMLLYRFSDAISELDPQMGTQVHRSFWVSYAGVESIKPRVKKFTVRLTNGEDVPVSGPYHNVVKELARARNLQVIA